jgi:hypothetical protein
LHGISSGLKEALGKVLDDLFDDMALKLLGQIPKYRGAKSIIFSTKPNETLAHLFVQSLGDKYPLPKEQEAMKSLVMNAEDYIESLRSKTKAKVIGGLDTFVMERRAKNIPIQPQDIHKKIILDLQSAGKQMKTIAAAETTKARNMGNAMDIAKIGQKTADPDPTVVFLTMKDNITCAECKRVHILPDGITPRPFKLSEVKYDYHKKGEDSPSVCGLHPHCFTGNARLHTDRGMLTFKYLFDNDLPIKVYSDTRIQSEGYNSKTPLTFVPTNRGSRKLTSTRVYDTGVQTCYHLALSNGAELTVSEYHDVWVKRNNTYQKIPANQVMAKDVVPLLSGEGGFGQGSFPDLAKQWGAYSAKNNISKTSKVPDMIWEADKETVASFLSGFFNESGQVLNGLGFVVFSKETDFVRDVQILLSNFGIPSEIKVDGPESYVLIKGRIACTLFLEKIGIQDALKFKRLTGELDKLSDFDPFECPILAITKLPAQQTYSLTEPLTNTVTANGVVTGNCRCTMTIVPKTFGFKNGRIAFVGLDYDFYEDKGK